jgi:hypothetical protein
MPFDPTAFANAESDFNRDDPPAPGEYEVELTETDIISAKDGRQFAKVVYKVVSGFARDHVWGVVHTLDALNRDGEPNGGLAITADAPRARHRRRHGAVDRRPAPRARALGRASSTSSRSAATGSTSTRSRSGAQLAGPQQSMSNGSTYGQPPAQQQRQQQPAQTSMGGGGGSAILQGDVPERSGLNLSTDDVRRDTERTGESDVPGAQPRRLRALAAAEGRHRPRDGRADPLLMTSPLARG